jgi:hypothetical protein
MIEVGGDTYQVYNNPNTGEVKHVSIAKGSVTKPKTEGATTISSMIGGLLKSGKKTSSLPGQMPEAPSMEVTPAEHSEALQWAQQNPDDPRAMRILRARGIAGR